MPDTNVYLIRHATPDWSRTDLPYHIPPGPPLTPQGVSEANELGEFLKTIGIISIQCSPLERCARTAMIAAGHIGLEAQINGGLSEWRPGEKHDEVHTRIWPTWEEACRASAAGGPVALVTHGGPIAVLLDRLGLIPEALNHYKRLFDRNNPLPPAGVWHATRRQDTWQLKLAFTPASQRSKLMV
jgi:broad specificity phosphatase PhoE